MSEYKDLQTEARSQGLVLRKEKIGDHGEVVYCLYDKNDHDFRQPAKEHRTLEAVDRELFNRWSKDKRAAVSSHGGLPKTIKPGRFLHHNHIMHTVDMSNGVNGFRCWTNSFVSNGFAKCPCGWSGLPHYALKEHIKATKGKAKTIKQMVKAGAFPRFLLDAQAGT
jgi:hypothetical protein